MPKIKYEDHAFKDATLATIAQANEIIETYASQGYDLTLRQLYYQFVSRDFLPNTLANYKRLGDIVSNARRAGLIDWSAIVDRTRQLRKNSSWSSPASIVDAVSEQFAVDRWEDQPHYVEVWFEKDALLGVFERAASRIDVPYFSCRGYPSDSEVLGRLVSSNVRKLLDMDAWEAKLEEEREGRRLLAAVSQNWDGVCKHVRDICDVDDITIVEPDDFEEEDEDDAEEDDA